MLIMLKASCFVATFTNIVLSCKIVFSLALSQMSLLSRVLNNMPFIVFYLVRFESNFFGVFF